MLQLVKNNYERLYHLYVAILILFDSQSLKM